MRGGAGGQRLPKATPRLGGGGGSDFVIATGPAPEREADVVPRSQPGIGPGLGGGIGAGAGGGLGQGRGAASAWGGAFDWRPPSASPGWDSARASGRDRHRHYGSGRAAAGAKSGTGGVSGLGYGSGQDRIGSGAAAARPRPGVDASRFGDIRRLGGRGKPGRGGGRRCPRPGRAAIRPAGAAVPTGAGGSGDSGAGNWPAGGVAARGRRARGRPGSRSSAPAAAMASTPVRSGNRARDELPGAGGGGGGAVRRRQGAAAVWQAVPGLQEYERRSSAAASYPTALWPYYDDPNETCGSPEPVLPGKPIPRIDLHRRWPAQGQAHTQLNPNGVFGDWSKLLPPLPGTTTSTGARAGGADLSYRRMTSHLQVRSPG